MIFERAIMRKTSSTIIERDTMVLVGDVNEGGNQSHRIWDYGVVLVEGGIALLNVLTLVKPNPWVERNIILNILRVFRFALFGTELIIFNAEKIFKRGLHYQKSARLSTKITPLLNWIRSLPFYTYGYIAPIFLL